jgi:predicted nucleotidyltransferase
MAVKAAAVDVSQIVPRELLERLVAAYQPERIYLFGSHARGDAGPDSDIDLMIVVPDDAQGLRRSGRLGYREQWKLRAPGAFEFHVRRRFKFETAATDPLSFPGTIASEGKLLYEARHG